MAWSEHDRVLLVLGTGSGKTVIAGLIIKNLLPARVLFLADSEELCGQPLSSLSNATGVIPALEKSDSRASLNAEIVVGSSQTLCKKARRERFPVDHFDYIFIDEAHRGTGRDIEIADYFQCAKVCGITATPFRSDVQDLAKWFSCVAYSKPMIDLIEEGFAPPWQIVTLPVEIDLANVKVRQSFGEKEYDAEESAHKIEPWFDEIARSSKKYIKGRHGIAFLPLKASSEKFAAICRRHEIAAVHVAGDSPNREEIFQTFREGKIELLCNAGVASTGVDLPIADLFLNLRLTKSLAWYQQAAGRAARPLPGVIDHLTEESQAEERRRLITNSAKKNALVLDLLWQNDMLGMIHAGHLVSNSEEEAQDLLKKTRKLREPLDLIELHAKVVADREERLRAALEEAASKAKGKLVPAEQMPIILNDDLLLRYHPLEAWEMQPPTPNQLKKLETWGVNPDGVRTFGYAHVLISAMIFRFKFKLAPLKALRLVKQLKVNVTHPERMKSGLLWSILRAEFSRRERIRKAGA